MVRADAPKAVVPPQPAAAAGAADVAFRVRCKRDADWNLQLSLVAQEGRVFLDTVHKPVVGVVQVLTDTKVYHQQTLP